MDIKEILELIAAVDSSNIAEFSLKTDEAELSIRKQIAFNAATITAPASPGMVPAVIDMQALDGGEPFADDDEDHVTIVAPMVGTFYRASAPDAPAYVQVGDDIDIGQPLCIIEAMKLMNEIESEIKGQVVRVLVENAQPVEYGQPLFVLRRT